MWQLGSTSLESSTRHTKALFQGSTLEAWYHNVNGTWALGLR